MGGEGPGPQGEGSNDEETMRIEGRSEWPYRISDSCGLPCLLPWVVEPHPIGLLNIASLHFLNWFNGFQFLVTKRALVKRSFTSPSGLRDSRGRELYLTLSASKEWSSMHRNTFVE